MEGAVNTQATFFADECASRRFDPARLSFYGLIEYLSLVLQPEDIVGLSHQLRNTPDNEIYSLARDLRRRCMFNIPNP